MEATEVGTGAHSTGRCRWYSLKWSLGVWEWFGWSCVAPGRGSRDGGVADGLDMKDKSSRIWNNNNKNNMVILSRDPAGN